ncbi:MAG TPA: filamentous hemagglutinin, partial [Verrucomicrobiales bacterium]|nr:filamentous hemagglutinin [Verrucomicrobiales bacterium]
MRNTLRTIRTLFFLSPWITGIAVANPNGGSIVAGAVDPLPAGGPLMNIGIRSDRAIIDWQSFSINQGELTRFNFDSANAAVLNRVTVMDPSNLSVIAGRLESNGRVILLNPNGILVTPTGVIDTRSFLGSTLTLDPASFMRGDSFSFTLEGSADGSIVNRGVVLAREKEGLPGGDVIMVARAVRNEGELSAPDGLVGLAAGSRVTLYDTGEQRLVVETEIDGALVENGPEAVIRATTAELKAAGGNIAALAINNEGVIRANTIVEDGGRIFLRASGGTAVNAGSLDASGKSGGHVEVTGDQVLLAAGSSVNADGGSAGGTVLVGGDYRGLNASVPNALRTVVAPDATISARATGRGNGGRVIVWADEVNRFYGTIDVRGGDLGGNGGFVETSGRDHLEAFGLVHAGAAHGSGGTWLLDPRNVTIDNLANAGGAFNGGTPNVFTPTADSAVASRNAIQTSLNAGTSVEVNTGSTGAQDGDITVAASITKSAGGNASL